MSIFQLLTCICALLVVTCRGGVPDGYILDVSHTCGHIIQHDNFSATGASVTIKSDLHVRANLKCANSVKYAMTPIDDENYKSTATIYYTGDGNATETSCVFSRPHNESKLYVAELDVFWGFTNGTLMNDYETYTITCTTGGKKEESLSGKTIDDNAVQITADLEGNLGSAYSNAANIKLLDVLGNEITANTIGMGKKVKLQLSISEGSEEGLTPYSCDAKNSDNSKTYRILNAGCGDGVIFPKNVGFDTAGKESTSPYFKVFRLLENLGNAASISYTCSFATCDSACNGTSCVLRGKRSLPEVTDQQSVDLIKSRKYSVDGLDSRLSRSENELQDLKLQSRLTISTMATVGVGAIAVLSLLIALYSCMNEERRRLKEKASPVKMSSA